MPQLLDLHLDQRLRRSLPDEVLSIVEQGEGAFFNVHLRRDSYQEMRVIGHDGNAINGEAARGRDSPPVLDQRFSQSGIEDAAAITRGEDQMMV